LSEDLGLPVDRVEQAGGRDLGSRRLYTVSRFVERSTTWSYAATDHGRAVEVL
jgi:hypothetical protein